MKGFFDKKQVASISRPDGKTYSCASCGLLKEATTPRMEPQGGFAKRILIVGAAPNVYEDTQGMLWVEDMKATRFLEKSLAALDIDLRKDCLYTNAVNCMCEKDPANYEIDCCRRNLMRLIRTKKPKVVLVFGDAPLYSLLGRRWQKDLGKIDKWRGYQIPDIELDCWLCPMQHPQKLRNNDESIDKILWKKDLRKAVGCLKKPIPQTTTEIEIIHDLSVLDKIKDGIVAIDYETTGIKPHKKGHRIVCMSVADTDSHCYAFLVPENKKEWKPILRLLTDPNVQKMAHNMKFEQQWSTTYFKTPVTPWLWDSMQAAHILDNRVGTAGLKFQTYVNFGIVDYDSKISPYLKSEDTKDGNAFNRIHEVLKIPGGVGMLLEYCGKDTIYQRRLALQQMQVLKDSPAYALFHDGILAFQRAENQGLRIHLDYVEKQKEELAKRIEKEEKEFKKTNFYKHWEHFSRGDVNLNSNAQLAAFLYKGKKLEPVKYTANETGATDEEALRQLNIPELNSVLHIRKLKKNMTTYLEAYEREQVDGYLHPSFNLHNVSTFRSSSSNPNFQNIPKRDKEAKRLIRGAIYPRPGHLFLEMDFSSLEVSIAACYHKDPVMLDYLRHGKDMHKDMAMQIFFISKDFDKNNPGHAVLRQAAKNSFVFPQFYGDYYKNNALGVCNHWLQLPTNGVKWKPTMGPKLPDGTPLVLHLKENGIKGFEDFVAHMKEIEYDFWNKRFKVYSAWKDKWYEEYLRKGYIENYTGFRFSGNMRRNEVINYPVQSSAFHCLLWSFNRLDNVITERKWDTRLIGQIHDALVIDVQPTELKKVMQVTERITSMQLAEEWKWIIVPLHVESEVGGIDKSWAEIKGLNDEEMKAFIRSMPTK